MPAQGSDLVRVAELIRLAAQIAPSLGLCAADGNLLRVADIAKRIEAAAVELAEVGNELQREGRSQAD